MPPTENEPIERVLSFELFSDFACFSRGYTTTSTLTYSIPPPTVLMGVVAAIIGLERDSYASLAHACRFALIPLSSSRETLISPQYKGPEWPQTTGLARTIRIKQNLLNTKDDTKSENIRVGFQYLINPRFGVYFHSSNREAYEKLKAMLQSRETLFTPYLGQASCIADVRYLGEVSMEEGRSDDNVPISSVLPVGPSAAYDMTPGMHYVKERLPALMGNNRSVSEFVDVLYEMNGRPIKIGNGPKYWIARYPSGYSENVVFL